MNWFTNMGLKGKLLCLSIAYAIGIIAFGAIAYLTIDKVKVGGPLYGQVVEGKDLIADVLPPPEYIIEPYLTTFELANQTDKAEIARLQDKMRALKNDYQARHEYWLSTLADGKLKQTLVDRSYQPAEAFYRAYENKLLPAIEAGDLEKAKEIVSGPLTRHYNAHRAEIDDVVKMANERNAMVEAGATSTIRTSTWTLLGVSAFTLVLFIVLGQMLANSISKFVAQTANELQAINRTNAVIEFDLEGKIRTANENFLKTVGYSLEEIKGQHHRMFCEPAYAQTNEYKEFWAKLGRGEPQAGEFKRVAKGGKEVFIQACYNPICDASGKPVRIVKYATDITNEVLGRTEAARLRVAIDNAQTPIIMVDRDFLVTYVNEQTRSILRKYQDKFRAIWPGFDPSKIMGACIDQFHKNPAHQRQLLSDPNKLPYKTDIQVGDLTFALTVSAQRDVNGKYIGNTLEWADVTEERRRVARNQKIESFQESEVSKVSSVLSAVANGDLTQHYDVAKADEDTADVFGTFSQIASAV
ncbi:MAG: PAS domain S-box protein, partial [Pirellulales bacterium]